MKFPDQISGTADDESGEQSNARKKTDLTDANKRAETSAF